jgi:hypothetical protein
MNGQPGTGQGGTIGAVPRNAAEAELLAAGFGNGVDYSGAAIEEPDLVWMGDSYTDPTILDKSYLGTTAAQTIQSSRLQSGWMTVNQAEAEWWLMDAPTKQNIIESVAMIDDKIPTDERARQKYLEYVRQGQTYTSVYPENPVSPMELMRRVGENAVQVRQLRGGSGSRTSRVVNLTNPDDARSLVNGALQQYLGRDATPEEVAEFTKALNQAERKNPLVTTPTQRSGGVSAGQRAIDFARSQEGSAEFLAETQYSDWFTEVIMRDPTEGVASGL